MEANITKKEILKNIPSASGLEAIGDDVYIIGDDSPYLFVCDKKIQEHRRILLAPNFKLTKGRISKAKKPDLEALASFDIGGEKVILILGSGSVRETRDKAFIVEPGENDVVNEYSLLPLYDLLRQNKDIVKERILNIEAAAVVDDQIYLFQRGNITGSNVLIEFSLYPFIQFLQDKRNPAPEYNVFSYNFEKSHGLVPGFSGATCIPRQKGILFTASLEDTPDEWYDGDVFESYIGIISENKKDVELTMILEDGAPYKGKVESITVLNQIKKGILELLAVTDSDGGASELLKIELKL